MPASIGTVICVLGMALLSVISDLGLSCGSWVLYIFFDTSEYTYNQVSGNTRKIEQHLQAKAQILIIIITPVYPLICKPKPCMYRLSTLQHLNMLNVSILDDIHTLYTISICVHHIHKCIYLDNYTELCTQCMQVLHHKMIHT